MANVATDNRLVAFSLYRDPKDIDRRIRVNLNGVFDIAGTIASGWLTDRVDPRWLLAGYYFGRALSLVALDAVLAPGIVPGMWAFIVFYGLD